MNLNKKDTQVRRSLSKRLTEQVNKSNSCKQQHCHNLVFKQVNLLKIQLQQKFSLLTIYFDYKHHQILDQFYLWED